MCWTYLLRLWGLSCRKASKGMGWRAEECLDLTFTTFTRIQGLKKVHPRTIAWPSILPWASAYLVVRRCGFNLRTGQNPQKYALTANIFRHLINPFPLILNWVCLKMNRSNTSPGFFWAFNVDVAKHRCGWIPNPISKTSTAIRNRWEDPGIAAYRPIDPTKGEMIMASPIPMLMDSPMGGTYCSYHLFF